MIDALATAALPPGVKPVMAAAPAAHCGPRTHRFGHQAMASLFEILCVHEDANYARQAANQAFDLLDRLEGDLSCFVENSDIARINNLQAGSTVRVSRNTMECLMLALLAIEETGGAFDISLGTGLRKLELRPSEYEVQANAAGIRLDLGGIGKGYAVDRMAEVLVDWGIDRALIHGGCSSVRALRPPPGKAGWPLRIGLPGEHAAPAYTYAALQCALSASGLQKGNHIIDPRGPNPSRLRPAAWVISSASVFQPAFRKMVSVGFSGEPVSESPAALAEVFSTAFLMLSRQEVDACRARWPGLEAWLAERDDGVPFHGYSLVHLS
ncbi:MAG: FAD:protein FMN transferase [Terracidiphilus sp.]